MNEIELFDSHGFVKRLLGLSYIKGIMSFAKDFAQLDSNKNDGKNEIV